MTRLRALLNKLRTSPEPAGAESVAPLEKQAAPPSPQSTVRDEGAYGVRWAAHNIPSQTRPGSVFGVRLTLENTGSLTWNADSPQSVYGSHAPSGFSVGLAVAWDDTVIANHKLPRAHVAPGECVTMLFALAAPQEPGAHRLTIGLVEYEVAVFADRGAAALELDLVVEDCLPDRESDLWTRMERVVPWQYLPTRGIARGASGAIYPVFTKRARGCRVWDTQDREYIDYTMGWGSVLLGYADPRVSAALSEVLDTGSVVAWPQPVEIELAEMLVEDFPSAEMVAFGKNGSDACTFAARMARVFTGRRTILFSGFHGWQDFWTEQVGFERTGVPPRDPPLIHRFPFHDLGQFETLYEQHKEDLAAVMIEPSPWAGDGLGFEPDTDTGFLSHVADATRRAGALFIMDEIVTGYRYPGHSVQKAKGVTPDLTCLGKAIGAGMPLSAVVGRADVFKQALPRTFFAATFHGEAYSFAAARAAIEIYRSEPVARHVWDYGDRLRAGIQGLCGELGIAAEMRGPPFRMSLIFLGSDQATVNLERTLLHQELMKRGITTLSGVMLPCYAHDDSALEQTLAAFGAAFELVARTAKAGSWDEVLEIPLLLDL